MENKIYLKGIKSLSNTVLCVDSKGQKTYYDPIYGFYCGYSSGSQVKRSIKEQFVSVLDKQLATVTLNYKIESGSLKQDTSIDNTDPTELDSIISGWMSTDDGLYRTSPLMISPLVPVHPKLSSINEEIHTFDRINNTNSVKISIKKDKKEKMSEEEIREYMKENERNCPTFLMKPETHVSGLFKYEVGIDLRTLCTIQLNYLKKQIDEKFIQTLLDEGWKKGKNYFGDCLIMPRQEREKLFHALSNSLIEWNINTHQSFNHNPCLTEAVSISYNSRKAHGALRPETIEDDKKNKTVLIFDKDYADNVFIEKTANYILNSQEVSKAMAMEDAKRLLESMMNEYDYDQFIVE